MKDLTFRITALWIGLQAYEDSRTTLSNAVAAGYMQLFKLYLN